MDKEYLNLFKVILRNSRKYRQLKIESKSKEKDILVQQLININ